MCTLQSPEKHLYPDDRVSRSSHSGPHLPTAPNASARTPLRALAPKTTQRRGLDCIRDRECLQIHHREGCGPHQITLPTCCVPVRLGGCQSDFRRQRRKAAASTSPPKKRRAACRSEPTAAQRIAHLAQLARRCPEVLPPTFMRKVVNLCLPPSKASSVKGTP